MTVLTAQPFTRSGRDLADTLSHAGIPDSNVSVAVVQRDAAVRVLSFARHGFFEVPLCRACSEEIGRAMAGMGVAA